MGQVRCRDGNLLAVDFFVDLILCFAFEFWTVIHLVLIHAALNRLANAEEAFSCGVAIVMMGRTVKKSSMPSAETAEMPTLCSFS